MFVEQPLLRDRHEPRITEITRPGTVSGDLRNTVVSDDISDLARLFEPSVAVCMVLRPLSDMLARHAAKNLAHMVERRYFVGDAEDVPAAAHLGGGEGGELLREDLIFLDELCRDLSGCTTVGVRLGVSARPLCPRFHVDRILVRLVCTYLGPGTEWCDFATDGPIVLRAPAFAIVALKGDAWPGNEGRGARHRSPSHASPRVMVSVEPL